MKHVGSGLGPGSGPGMEAPKPSPTRDEIERWLLNSVIYFRQMGFFGRYQDKTDAEVLTAAKALQEEVWEEPFDDLLWMVEHLDMQADLVLLQLDGDRIYFEVTDMDYTPDAPTQIMRELSFISRGAFLPQNIQQHFDYGESPTVIEFDFDNSHYEVKDGDLVNSLPLTTLRQINAIVESSGLRFEAPITADTGYFLMLTAQEKKKLEAERGWEFWES